MDGWQHTTRDYDPATDGDEEAWARAVAAEGWRTWHASGVWVTVGNRRVRRWSLRRSCARPWSAHDHGETCLGGTPGDAPGGRHFVTTTGPAPTMHEVCG